LLTVEVQIRSDKSRFDVRIVGEDAKKLVERLFAEYPELLSSDWKKRPTISCAFRVGDIQPVVFETTDQKTQEKIQTPSIDGRLLKFKFIKVDGKLWYSEKEIEIGSEHSSDLTESDEAIANQN
jgi:hypothetical protein